MKKNNNKGFTLIELLAVVVILLAISVIAISSISAAIERNKAKQNKAKFEIIESYAKLYYDQHKNSLPDNKIYISDLNLSSSEAVDADGEPICGYFVVDINNNNKLNFTEDRYSCHGTVITTRAS